MPEECGICFPTEYIKLAKIQYILVKGDFIYPNIMGIVPLKVTQVTLFPHPAEKFISQKVERGTIISKLHFGYHM